MDFGGAVSGAAGGAGIGTAVLPGIGTAVGAGLGFLSGLFGDSAATKQKKRIEEGMRYLKEARRNTITTGMDRLGKQIAQNKASAVLGAGRRAMASGNADAAESLIAPAETRANAAGGEAVNQFMDSTTRQYDQAELSLQMEGLNTPIEPGVGDYLLPIGQAALSYKLNKDYTDTLGKLGPTSGPMGDTTAGEVTPGIASKIEGTRDPVLSGEFAGTGGNPPANTLGLGALNTPRVPRTDKILPRYFGQGNVYPSH